MGIKTYDLAIVGAGPAGYSAGIYASRYQISNIIIGQIPGGTIGEADKVCNFPSEEEIAGFDLAKKIRAHAKKLGSAEVVGLVTKIVKNKDDFELNIDNKRSITARSVLLAIGLTRRKLEIAGEAEFLGKGVSYCATCDGAFFKDKTVAVIGGANAANTASLNLSKVAKKVYQIYRGNRLKGDMIWIEQVKSDPKINILYETHVEKIIGKEKISALVLDREINGSKELPIDGIFIEAGSEPDTDLAKGLGIKMTKAGYIEVDAGQATNIDGVFAAGDITNNSNGVRQVVTACSEGAVASDSIFKYLR